MPDHSSASTTKAGDDVLISPDHALSVLRRLSPEKIESLARISTVIQTSEGPITDQSITSVVAGSSINFNANKNWTLTVNGKPLEITVTVFPRSTWAYNNGPAGNFAQIGWKTNDKIPSGITLDSRRGNGSDDNITWVKTTRSGTELGIAWTVQLWNKQFTTPRTAEYAVSGRPVCWETAVHIHDAIDARYNVYAASHNDVVKKQSTHGPTSSMFLSGRRSVFLPNATPLDEGRQSEYDDSFGILPLVKDSDLRFNRVPEVLVYDSVKKIYSPMSFHNLHRLGNGVVINMTLAPMAFSYSRGLHKPELNWEYRLVNLTVLGRREDDALASPSKHINKRKLIALNIDDDSDDDRGRKDRRKVNKSSGSGGTAPSKPAAGSAASSSGGKPKPADKPAASGSGSTSATASEGD
ncbi:hypothetical protein B0H13DRAFT_1879273 [Mycena leptocephala]|nr:hypothetical protein B0H13DRAFT_1879273 [Mycena leptocephala]